MEELSVPLSQAVLYAALITISLLLNRTKFGLCISYVFVFYWGYVYNQDTILETLGGSGPSFLQNASVYLYLVFGLFIIILALITFYKEKKT